MKKTENKTVYRKNKTLKASRLMTDLLSPALKKQGFTQNEIITRWPQIVGVDIADNVLPIKIAFASGQRQNGTLSVRTESAFAPVLQHRIPIIIEMVNQYYGYAAVGNITIQQGPLPKKTKRPSNKRVEVSEDVSTQVYDIVKKNKNEALRDVLKNLGEQMLEKDKNQ